MLKASHFKIARRRWTDPAGLAIDLVFSATALVGALLWACS
ncbi:MAG: hypothetical protein P8K76_03630 [Candidatus Binatia bacterium]|nr:hypothetical protein [Candidatus Binatia bacterium]MDG2008855.1 hypothetical protein [Candidatus Binatia bacterium]